MSSFLDALNETSIVMPTPYIKAPGSLLLDYKSTSTKSEESTFQSLFKEFKTRSELHEKTLLCNEKENEIERDSRSRPSLGSFVKRYNCVTGPGDMKRVSENIADLIKIAQKLLSFYGVNLVTKISGKNFKNLYKSLKALVFEVSLLPMDLFRKLRITELVFCEEINETISQDKTFLVDCSDDQRAILNRLYQIIFNHIVKQNPQILVEWDQSNVTTLEDLTVKPRLGLQEAFLLLMRSVNNSVLKSDYDQLKNLLEKYYPEMSEEWLNNRLKEKKKMTKVSFTFSLEA